MNAARFQVESARLDRVLMPTSLASKDAYPAWIRDNRATLSREGLGVGAQPANLEVIFDFYLGNGGALPAATSADQRETFQKVTDAIAGKTWATGDARRKLDAANASTVSDILRVLRTWGGPGTEGKQSERVGKLKDKGMSGGVTLRAFLESVQLETGPERAPDVIAQTEPRQHDERIRIVKVREQEEGL